MQCCHSKDNAHSFLYDHTGMSNSVQCMDHTASHHHACLSTEILHFNVEYHVAINKLKLFLACKVCLFAKILHFNDKHHVAVDKLKPIGWHLAFRYNLQCDLHIFHLFLNSILPEGISILLVNGISLFNCLRQLKPKFVGYFKLSQTALSNYESYTAFFQDMVNLPVQCWFMLNALSYGIFGNLNCV